MAVFNGSNGDDIINGGAENDSIAGQGGNDTLSGGGGQDTLSGGSGADVIDGGDGADAIYTSNLSPFYTRPYYSNPWTAPVMDIGAEVDTVTGGAGSDKIFAGYGDNVDGGADDDSLIISFQGAASGVTVDFRALANNGSLVIGGGTIRNIEIIEWVEGSNFADTITMGDDFGNFAPVFGMGGNDHIIAGYATGDIHGGDGDDIIDRGPSPYGFENFGEAGNDLLIGSYNGETLDGGDGNDELRGNGGFDRLNGGNGDDLIDGGSSDDDIRGGAGNDTIHGGSDNDTIDGGAGNDVIRGDFSPLEPGNGYYSTFTSERIFGGAGADIIYGEEGNDLMWSGERDGEYGVQGKDDVGLERDQLFGGTGDDTLSIGHGDDADGGDGSDSPRISLAGAASGVVLSTSGFTSGGVWSVNGGSIQNIESLTAIVGSAFGDTITVATHSFGLTVDGGAGDDVITSSSSSVIADGGAGNDIFISGAAGDIWNGGAGSDTIDYRNSSAVGGVVVTLAAVAGQTVSGPGSDQLTDIENVVGSAFDDTLTGNGEANVLRGEAGNDTLDGGSGNDILMGGDGTDTVSYASATAGVTVSLGQTVAQNTVGAGADTLSGFERLTGSGFGDWLTAGAGDTIVRGGGGNDILVSSADGDRLFGEAGDDMFVGGAGNDLFAGGAGIDTIDYSAASGGVNTSGSGGANGSDTFSDIERIIGSSFNDNLGGAAVMIGGAGNDVYTVYSGTQVVVEAAGQGTDRVESWNASFTLSDNVENLSLHFDPYAGASIAPQAALNGVGNVLDNIITGSLGANQLDGLAGADTLYGGGGDDVLSADRHIGFDNMTDVDTLFGEGGNDSIFAGYGDIVDGGTGFDVVYVSYIGASAGIVGDTATLFQGQPLAAGGGTLSNIESFATMALTTFDDTMVVGDQSGHTTVYAWDGDDTITGQRRDVTFHGGDGNDLLVGGISDDVLNGDNGDDRLLGGEGVDTLTGGNGRDRFFFVNLDVRDRIVDFASGTDRIDLTAIDANVFEAGDQAFAYIGDASFTGVAGQLRGYWGANNTYFIAADVNGDKIADLVVEVGFGTSPGAPPIGADFLF